MAKKKQVCMPDYNATEDEIKARDFCINNNIRISPLGMKEDSSKWKIGINIGPYKKGEKPNIAPHIYDKDTIWVEYFNFCKYYYDKYR